MTSRDRARDRVRPLRSLACGRRAEGVGPSGVRLDRSAWGSGGPDGGGADGARHGAPVTSGSSMMPRVLEGEPARAFDREILREMGALGLLGCTLPEEYGCAGLNYTCYGLVRARRWSGWISGYRSAMSVQSSLVMWPIWAFGTEEMRPAPAARSGVGGAGRLLRADRAGCRVGPGGDEDAGARAEGGWRLTGTKMWITNFADRRRVRGVGEGRRGGDPRLRAGKRGWTGCRRRRSRASSACAPSVTGEIVMDDVFCPEGRNAFPEVRGLKGPVRPASTTRATASPGGRWGRRSSAGTRRATTRLERTMFGRPLAATQLVQEEAGGHADRNPRWGWRGGAPARSDEGPGPAARRRAISLMKRNNCGKALEIAPRVARYTRRQRHRPTPVPRESRHVMNLEAVNTYEAPKEQSTP